MSNDNLAVALHEIEYTANGKRQKATPNRVFEVPEGDRAFLTKQGAIREPSEAELALYEKQNVTKTKPAAKAKGGKAEGGKPEGGKPDGGAGEGQGGGGSGESGLV